MKLLILSSYFTPDLSAGSFRIQALCDEIVKNYPNANVDILTTKPNRYSTYSKPALNFEKFGNVNITRFDVRPHSGNLLSQILTFLDFSYKVYKNTSDKKYNIVFASSSRLMTASLGALISRKVGANLYLDIRDLFLDTILSVFTFKAKIFLFPILSFIERFTFSSARKINLVSRGFEDYVKKKYPNQNLSFYPNGIDDVFLDLPLFQNNQKITHLETKDKIKILYAGNLGEGQVIDKILPDISNCLDNKYEFIIIGDGSRKNCLEQVLIKRGLKNVMMLDPMPRDELIQQYNNADILFLHLDDNLAFKKVLPSKIFEYAAIGKPILAGVSGYAESFINEFIDNAKVFPPCNAKRAIEAMNKLVIINQSREKFIKTFSRSKIMENLAKDIFDESNLNTTNLKTNA